MVTGNILKDSLALVGGDYTEESLVDVVDAVGPLIGALRIACLSPAHEHRCARADVEAAGLARTRRWLVSGAGTLLYHR